MRPGARACVSTEILRCLERVDIERQRREADPPLQLKVQLLKQYQQRRFEWTYRDLAASPRYCAAVRFFLVDLYGPLDFRQRDQEFARIVPRIEKFFPAEVRATVLDLARLHALSEELDSAMARALAQPTVGPLDYVQAWRHVGRRQERVLQLEWVLAIGRALDRHTRHAWLVNTLKLMRVPARAAGLSALQAFLERGMTGFRSIGGATEFLGIIEAREIELMNAMFADEDAVTAILPAP